MLIKSSYQIQVVYKLKMPILLYYQLNFKVRGLLNATLVPDTLNEILVNK